MPCVLLMLNVTWPVLDPASDGRQKQRPAGDRFAMMLGIG
jgi:hypothetical protein